jgi:hypothetical protein
MINLKKHSRSGALLDFWRPPQGAGDPVGCLATTYTFTPGLFDEQCLARFLGIESEPNREDLAFLLERETRLGAVYAGILVDHTEAGVEHSLRWDILPVRLRAGKQHAKLSLLAWGRHIRIIVASANLTEPGYRTNFEVATAVDLTPTETSVEFLLQTITFLRSLIQFVPGASEHPSNVSRAEAFLDQIEHQTKGWNTIRRKGSVRQRLVCTLPSASANQPPRSALEEALKECRGRGGAPNEVWIASPFFDSNDETGRAVATLCKAMGRGSRRDLYFSVPAFRDGNTATITRLAAPKALWKIPPSYHCKATIEILPEVDNDKNPRQWHAKMMALQSDPYYALMVGSSNFTCAGMGIGSYRNIEANLITIIDHKNFGREAGQLEAVWPETTLVKDPESAEWLGAQPENEEEEQRAAPPLPAGFLCATYCAGDQKQIILRFDPLHLPDNWGIHACGSKKPTLLTASIWRDRLHPSVIEVDWTNPQPPEKLIVQWEENEAFWAVNVDDPRQLPPPSQLEHMSADDMLQILAASDPSAAFRIWSRRQQPDDQFDSDLDSGTPIDLDPLRHYDLEATFLHRIRRRARILAQLRLNLQKPVWGRQALEWKLRGLIGIEPLADRFVRELEKAEGAADEELLTLADFLIVLRGVDYQSTEGSLSKVEFEKVFRPFLKELTAKLKQTIDEQRERLSEDLMGFWKRICERCQY